jgi:hypothetical protein
MTLVECIVVFFAGYGLCSALLSLIVIAITAVRR